MAERDRTDADSDIEFEFFDEPPTVEHPPPPPPTRRGGPPGEPPARPRGPGDRTPLLRLAALIVGVIALVVVLVFWVQSCRGGKKDSYNDYLQAVGAVVKESDGVGQDLSDLLTTPGLRLDELATQLGGLVQQQSQVVARAEQLSPPGALLDVQRSLVESLQLRQSGLTGLKEAFARIEPATPAAEAGATLAEQANRLIAGDVVYEDLFKARAQAIMREEGITGVAVPDSQFLPNPDLASQDSLAELFERLTQGTAGTGLHGNNIVSVKAQPGGETLSVDSETKITVSDRLRFIVTVKNSGDFQETQVKVTLTIQQEGGPIQKSAEIDLIGPGKTRTVEFTDFSTVTLITPTTLKVAVKPVPGETNTSNNVAEYPVVFTLD